MNITQKKGSVHKPTMNEVAKKSGVALSTVSHVINGTAPISDETKARVQKVIEELNYTPNALARGLRHSRTNTIGIIVPDLTNEFYAKYAACLIKLAGEDEVSASLIDFGYKKEREERGVDTLIRSRVDGVIFLGGSQDENLIERLDKANIITVFADRYYKDYPSVSFDNYETMYHLIRCLWENGYTKIGYISEAMTMVNLIDRYRGIMDALNNYNMELQKDWTLEDSWLRMEKLHTAKDMVNRLIGRISRDSMPEVLIASSDMIAIGILDALLQHGYKVPEDIGVVGYDDMTMAAYYNPSVTTVHQDYAAAARETYRLLCDKLAGREENEHVVIHNELIIRKSLVLKK
ncbi:LacI family DNA-binding transcriptional regulator [Murimonas intestini]|uniref:LacI family transcriptional regulator n=1 Tax=Murimonas intestini TaxID=1337051 RepID=A0AB73T9C6_9FIRM|nr:LacI family DNA-binding transcriptional regulator [Murimonas intestini]MCR1839307.1 LacI family transcriptional regulator [Murimonas intestini]MCR1864602.1 LacI family transcriptional regulator [Murimonas intestini]MCR1882212.1 LacI family transcriptional regulator [Murimonas intestini]